MSCVQRKQAGFSSKSRPPTPSVPDDSTPSHATRSATEPYHAKECCVICAKKWFRGKRPDCKVTTHNSQEAVITHARQLKRNDILQRLVGAGHDMVANDICYHAPCMNAFKATRVPVSKTERPNLHDSGFELLIQELETNLFVEKQAFLIQSLRDRYRVILASLGVQNSEKYRSITLKQRLQQYFGSRVTVVDQSCGAGFLCASNIALGDAIDKLRKLENDRNENKDLEILKKAAKILRKDAKQCKKDQKEVCLTEISTEAASKLIPDNYYNFLNYLLTDKTQMPDPGKSRVCTNKVMEEKILIMAQQILQHVCGVVTPLSVGTGYHLYNQTRSKDLITLNNRLGQSIGYDSLHRKLTAESASILQQIEEDGVYIPDSMTATADVLQVFAMDNLDWKNKTIEGGSFHATTAIAVENINL